MKTLHCADAGFDCQAVVRETTIEAVLEKAAAHAKEVHGVELTEAMAEQIRKLVKEED